MREYGSNLRAIHTSVYGAFTECLRPESCTMSIVRFKPILITCGQKSIVLRPYETLADLSFLLGAGIEKSRCLQTTALVPYKLRSKLPFDVPSECSIYVGRGQVEWDGTSLEAIKGGPAELIDWETEIEPGDRIEFRSGKVQPRWDDQKRELWLGRALIKQFKNTKATNQEFVLNAFEEDGWPARIDDPIPSKSGIVSKRKLADTIDALNESHKSEGVIKFRGDGTGEGVVWDAV
jgi:hypothetical protein